MKFVYFALVALALVPGVARATLVTVEAVCDAQGQVTEYRLETDDKGRQSVFWNDIFAIDGNESYLSTLALQKAQIALLPDGAVEIVDRDGRHFGLGSVDPQKVAAKVHCGQGAADVWLTLAMQGWEFTGPRLKPRSLCHFFLGIWGGGSGWYRRFEYSVNLRHRASGEKFKFVDPSLVRLEFPHWGQCFKTLFQ